MILRIYLLALLTSFSVAVIIMGFRFLQNVSNYFSVADKKIPLALAVSENDL